MRLFLRLKPAAIVIQMRAETSGVIGDFRQEISPGQTFARYSYDELRALGDGQHDLPEKPAADE